ncbi:hypothetical protein IHE45_20G023000 [Dioscorea alata]|uniref:Uncharacterized protein n=1 Tax=Dioscorea alata TaxID=55571 RepID=A0ACB7TQK3_DIOAL|nr:hypothetical protein IHE45_20G023000 [Dioscorea alata]
MSFFSLPKPKPLGPLRDLNQGARRSQKTIISPLKITVPIRETIRFLRNLVGSWVDDRGPKMHGVLSPRPKG